MKDINGLVGNKLPIQIPQVVVKWITFALVIHIFALVGAAVSAFFGLLAHLREMSTTCCSTFISFLAAVIALTAFIIDLVLFFVAKARISSVGSATIGSAIWLTLSACVLLFFSGCFYSWGKDCIRDRRRSRSKNNNDRDRDDDGYNKDRARAVRAEEARKERGLPKMPEIVETEPLTASYIDGDEVRINPRQKYRQQSPSGGYVPGARGTTAVDDYYNGPQNTYSRPNPYPQNSYPTSNAYSTPNTYPPSREPSVPSHTSSVAPSLTAYYGSHTYAPSPPVPDGLSSCEPAHIPGAHSELITYYPDFSATGPGQHPNYNPNPYGEIRSSPSPHQNTLLEPPRPSAVYSSTPPSTLNRPTASPNIIHPSPSPQQNLQRGYTLRDVNHEARGLQPPQIPPNPYVIEPSQSPQQLGHSGYTPGGVEYETQLLSNQSTSSQPAAIPYVPSPPLLQNDQLGYTSGDGNYEAWRLQPSSNPFAIQPSSSPQPTATPYVPSPPPPPPPLPPLPSDLYAIHSSTSPEGSHQGGGRGNYIPRGDEKSREDSPPGYSQD